MNKFKKFKVTTIIILSLTIIMCNFTNVEAKKISKQNISDIYNFACDKLWNSGFCDMNWYCTERTDSIGQKMNPEKKMKKIKKYMSDAKKWDKVVKSLKGKKYKKLKKEWEIIYSESKRMYKELQKLDFEEIENDPDIKYDLKVNKFQNHLYKLMDVAYSL